MLPLLHDFTSTNGDDRKWKLALHGPDIVILTLSSAMSRIKVNTVASTNSLKHSDINHIQTSPHRLLVHQYLLKVHSSERTIYRRQPEHYRHSKCLDNSIHGEYSRDNTIMSYSDRRVIPWPSTPYDHTSRQHCVVLPSQKEIPVISSSPPFFRDNQCHSSGTTASE